jgi:NIMA (never in mitosis gene a)-related kinase
MSIEKELVASITRDCEVSMGHSARRLDFLDHLQKMQFGGSFLPGFTVLKQLGQGSYGTVYKVRRQSDGKNYALKTVDLSALNQRQREDSVNEIRIMASVTSPFIIGFHEAIIHNHRLSIVSEYAQLGDLAHIITRKRQKHRPFKEEAIWRFMLEMLEGLRVLHERGIVHRDLKSANILVVAPDLFKIGDLGISTVLQQRQLAKTQIGTPMYLAPEVWKKRPYNSKCDIWSLGVLLYEMATFSYPYNARNARDLSVKVCTARAPQLTENYSRDLSHVIHLMLTQNPVQRPSVVELLEMPVIRSKNSLIVPFLEAVRQSEANLLETIRVPANLKLVNLPVPRYTKQSEVVLPVEERLHLKGKMAAQTRLSLASTRELQLIIDLDCWSPTKPDSLARLPARASSPTPEFSISSNRAPCEAAFRPRPPPPREERPNPRVGRATPPSDQILPEARAPRPRYRRPLVIW